MTHLILRILRGYMILKNVKTLPKYLGLQGELLLLVVIELKGRQIRSITKAEDYDWSKCSYEKIIDGKGAFLAPGLIDPQVHFREPGGEYKETLETGCKAAAKGGFTTVITMPNTNPTTDNPEVVKRILTKVEELDLIRILPTASVTKGLLGKELTDFEALKSAGIIALTDDGKGVQSDEVMFEAMSLAAKFDLPILDHSEDEELSNNGAIHDGEVSRKYGVPGIKASSESVHVKRGCDYSLATGCHYHVLHISTAESIDHVRKAKEKGAKVTCEVSPHHLLLCDEDIEVVNGRLDSNFKMNPPLRSRYDKEACVSAFLDGTIDFVATDHAPHSVEEKTRDITEAPFGIVGLETAFPLLYTNFVVTGLMSLEQLVDKMTIDAARVFNIPYGNISPDCIADLVLIDLNNEREINVENFASKGRNTPFKNWKCFGFPIMTICNGKVVFKDESM